MSENLISLVSSHEDSPIEFSPDGQCVNNLQPFLFIYFHLGWLGFACIYHFFILILFFILCCYLESVSILVCYLKNPF